MEGPTLFYEANNRRVEFIVANKLIYIYCGFCIERALHLFLSEMLSRSKYIHINPTRKNIIQVLASEKFHRKPTKSWLLINMVG